MTNSTWKGAQHDQSLGKFKLKPQNTTTHPLKLKLKRLTTPNISGDMEQLVLSKTADGGVKRNVKYTPTLLSSNFTPRIYQREMKTHVHKKTCTGILKSSFIHHNPK